MSHTSDPTTDPFLDEEWLATKGPRSRWRLALLTALAVAVVFLAGVQVQEHFGASPGTAATSGPGFPTGQGIPTGFPPIGGGNTQPSSGSSDAGQKSTSLIGTVTRVHGDTLQVKDFGGTTHTITIGPHTSITRPADLHHHDILQGTTVVVEQGHGSSKRRPATSITVR